MAARRGETQAAKLNKDASKKATKPLKDETVTNESIIEEHLPPLSLVFVVLLCSGALMVMAMRDFMSTGRNIAGSWDEAMLLFTKSTDWFEDVKGWKSTQGGFSAVKHVTTDENNMGGFFVRKMAGAAAVAVHLQKMIPLLVHPSGAQWTMGHFRPLLWTALVGNAAIAAFYILYLEDLTSAGVAEMTYCILSILALESLVILYHLLSSRHTKKGIAVRMPDGKTPSSPPSKIVARTVAIVSTAMLVIFGRDLFFPGTILDFFPRDDIYLEWTNAFLHSPPQDSPEAMDQGLEAPLYIGDKFISQLMALHILVLCMYKFVTAFWIRYGNDGSGLIQAKMIWTVQAVGDGMILFLFRIFTPAAASASLDLRWHLMSLAYEMFILGLYGFF